MKAKDVINLIKRRKSVVISSKKGQHEKNRAKEDAGAICEKGLEIGGACEEFFYNLSKTGKIPLDRINNK